MSPSRPRLTEQETRARVLQVAHQRLMQHGLTVGLESISMEQVIQDADVSRASAYRCWPHRDDFLADVLVHAVQSITLLPEDDADIARLAGLLAASHMDSAQGRRDLVVEALRISLDADIRRMLSAPDWRVFLALSVTHAALPDARLRDTVAAALSRMETEFTQRRAIIYHNLADLIGYRQRAPWTGEQGWQMVSVMAGLAMRGVVSRAIGDPAWLDERSELNPFGTTHPAQWSQAEVALATVLLSHLEPDPAVDWSAEHISDAEQRFVELSASLGVQVLLRTPES